MARRNPPAKWVLPEVVDPDRLCIQIEVPNDPAYIAAFRGALLELASAYKWADDTAHTAKDVALVWRDIIDNMGDWGCSMLTDVRQNDELPCVLEKNLSGEWQSFANLRYCPPNLRIAGGKIQYFDEGTQTWVDYPTDTGGAPPAGQPGTQPGGDEPVPIGTCNEILLTVMGNGVTAVPFRVLPGDSVLLSAIVGGWTYNASATDFTWMCGTGKIYTFGVCGATDGDTTGAIISGKPLGKLICQYGTHFFDAQTLFTIPSTWDEATLFLRMNDPDLGDNAGSVTAKAEICSGQWCYEWNLASALGGWTIIRGNWVSGSGVQSVLFNGAQQAYIERNIDAGARITEISMTYTVSGASGVNDATVRAYDAPSPTYGNQLLIVHDSRNGTITTTWTGDLSTIRNVYLSKVSSGNSVLQSVRLRGLGTNPFGTDNCA